MDGHTYWKMPGAPSSLWLSIVAAIAGAALLGWNFYFFEQLLAALIFYSAVAIPLLALVFVLVVAEEVGIQGLARIGRLLPRLHHGLQVYGAVLFRRDVPSPVRPLTFVPRVMRELHLELPKLDKGGFHLPTRRRAA